VPRALSPKQNGLFYRIGSKSGSRTIERSTNHLILQSEINNACPRRRLHNACRPHDKSPAVSSQNPIRRRDVYISPKNCKLAHGSALWESTPAEPPEPLTAYAGNGCVPRRWSSAGRRGNRWPRAQRNRLESRSVAQRRLGRSAGNERFSSSESTGSCYRSWREHLHFFARNICIILRNSSVAS
jgi:hypothetical protein